jgi:hypothetical protein
MICHNLPYLREILPQIRQIVADFLIQYLAIVAVKTSSVRFARIFSV